MLGANILNYCALTVAILKNVMSKQHSQKFSGHPDKVHPQFDEDDLSDMRKLKAQGISWPELGRIYDVPWTTVYGRIRPRK
ncbi:hypothetical protein [Desulfitobacterium sp. AusDCA]|uniref:hypothetical protein n=1 Tax=Desulfitobacterium sp. AusDCA TaxID=3240383 RepID=UPI003DA72BDD